MLSLNKRSGFTLIELMVVIAIISMLASIVLVSLNGARSKARDSQRIQSLRQLQNALELYRSNTGSYPIATCISSPWWECWGAAGQSTTNRLVPVSALAVMPQDPSFVDRGGACGPGKDGSFMYAYFSDNGQRYYLVTNLENPVSTTDYHYYDNTPGGIGCTAFGNWQLNTGF